MDEPPGSIDEWILNRIQGSMIGMALGDALGAHVEFRPHDYLLLHPVTDLGEGGTWGLSKGQVRCYFLFLIQIKSNWKCKRYHIFAFPFTLTPV